MRDQHGAYARHIRPPFSVGIVHLHGLLETHPLRKQIPPSAAEGRPFETLVLQAMKEKAAVGHIRELPNVLESDEDGTRDRYVASLTPNSFGPVYAIVNQLAHNEDLAPTRTEDEGIGISSSEGLALGAGTDSAAGRQKQPRRDDQQAVGSADPLRRLKHALAQLEADSAPPKES